ncbi:hypothetical protein DAETH_41490 (plasmid) [Deinococcus aetherius]|uniref:DUF1517 domain-containing protein n=1 Tax=Deinococcus aetherius TaxID=200252 RepID=A0ABM8AK32_9DEIO|nr:DUF1517 domain-containing protein [Deinococcus aetherius]BDP44180.1 hypothetical protein DAETH_41490 [Deinococcus aetherius]
MNRIPSTRRPAHVLLRPLRLLPLLSALLLGGALGVTGGGFGGTTSHSSTSSHATPQSRPAPVPSPTYSPSVVTTSSTSVPTTSTPSPGSSWSFTAILVVVGALLAFLLLSALYEEWAGRGRGAQAVRVQVLFENGEEVKRHLQRLARRHDPDAPGALAILLRESALLLLRHKEDWAYGTVERHGAAGEDEANSLVGQWATAARATFETQTTSQYQDGDAAGGYEHDTSAGGRTGGLYLAVTLAVSTAGLEFAPETGETVRDVESALLALSGVGSGQLLRLEAVWSPDGEGEFLSEEQAIRRYPVLAPL